MERTPRRAWLRGTVHVGLALLVSLEALAAGPRGGDNDGPAAAPSLLLISIDTLRADHLGCYGYPRPTSPTIDRLAGQGVLFEDVTSPSPWTLPAHASMLTGLYPHRHGLKDHDRRLADGVATLAEVLQANGFATAAFVNSHNLSRRYGLDSGFADFSYLQESVRQVEPARVVDDAERWLEGHREGRTFLFLHTYDVHSDYRSLERYERLFVRPYAGLADGTTAQLLAFRVGRVQLGAGDAGHLVDLYDAGIRQLDDRLARLFALLDRTGLAERTVVVVTSDHGEEFFEHGGVLHGRTDYQEVLHVPLVVRGPGLGAAPRRDATPVSLVDLVPTLLGLLGVPVPGGLDGLDLSGLIRADEHRPTQRLLFAEADHNNVALDVKRAVRSPRFKLCYDRRTRRSELYDLVADPGERNDLSGSRPDLVGQLLARLEAFESGRTVAAATLPALDEDDLELLKSLGYIDP